MTCAQPPSRTGARSVTAAGCATAVLASLTADHLAVRQGQREGDELLAAARAPELDGVRVHLDAALRDAAQVCERERGPLALALVALEVLHRARDDVALRRERGKGLRLVLEHRDHVP